MERLDKDLYVARNQIDVFSDKIGELAQKRIDEADRTLSGTASTKAKEDAIKTKKEAERLLKATQANYGSYLTKQYQLVQNKPGGALANGLSKYEPEKMPYYRRKISLLINY